MNPIKDSSSNLNFFTYDRMTCLGSLIKKTLDWSSVIITSVNLYEPHRIAYYLYELASSFHSLWNQGKIDTKLKFINEEDLDVTYARLSLIIATQKTIKSGLDLLGVSAPNEMQ